MLAIRNSKRLIPSLPFGRISAQNLQYISISSLYWTQTANLRGTLTDNFRRSFSQGLNFEKITSYENLNHRIAASSTISDVMRTYEQNAIVFKRENLITVFKTLGYLAKPSNIPQLHALEHDKRFHALTSKIEEFMDQFKEEDFVTIFFWLQRFRSQKINGISEANVSKLVKKVDELIHSKSFSFKNLVSLYYYFSHLERNTDGVLTALLKELRTHEIVLAPETIIQILEACYASSKGMLHKEALLIENVQKTIYPLLPDMNNNQRCTIFKYMGLLELHLNPIRFRIPLIMYTIKNLLKDSIQSLTEYNLTQILDGYRGLPRDFPNNLLEETKELVVAGIKQNSANLKSSFLLDFLDRVIEFEGYRILPDNKITMVYDEIAKRIPEESSFSKIRNLEKVIEIYEKAEVKHILLIQKVYDKMIGLQSTFFSGPILQCLINHGFDIVPLLDKHLANIDIKTIGNFHAVKIFIILSSLKVEKYQSLKESLQKKFLASAEEVHKFISLIANSKIKNKEIDEVLKTMIATLKSVRGKINETSFYQGMIHSTISKEIRQEWKDWADQNLANLDVHQLQKLTDAIFSNQDLTSGQVLLYTYILYINPPENIPLKKIMYGLLANKRFITELSKAEVMFQKFLERLKIYMNVHKEQTKLPVVFGVVKCLDSMGLKFQASTALLKKAYQISIESKGLNKQPIEVIVTLYLLNENALSVKEAIDFYKEWKESLNDINLSSKYLSYILQRSPQAMCEDEHISQEVDDKLQILEKHLAETTPKQVLTALASILAFPPKFIENNKDFLTKTIKEFIGLGTPQLYIDLIKSLPVRYSDEHFNFYLPFLRELANHYETFKKKLPPSEIVVILKKFTDFNYRNINLYAHFVPEIGRVFYHLKYEEYCAVVSAFASMYQNPTDLFDRILYKISTDPFGFSISIKTFIINFFKVGYRTQAAKTSIPQIYARLAGSLTPSTNLAFYCYMPVLDLASEFETEFLEKNVSSLKLNEHFPFEILYYTYEYLRLVYKDKPHLAEKIKSLKSNFDTLKEKMNRNQKFLHHCKKAIGEYLQAMEVPYKEDFVIDGYKIDLYIPSQKVIVKIFHRNELDYEKEKLTGKGKMIEKIYRSFEDYKCVFVNFDQFQKANYHINKVNYLINKGIENNNIKGIYDFSHIKKDQKPASHVEESAKDEASHEMEEDVEPLVEEKDEKEDKEEKDDKDLDIVTVFHHDLTLKLNYNPGV